MLTAAAKLYLWLPFTTDVLCAFSCRNISKADANHMLLSKAHICIVKELEEDTSLSRSHRRENQDLFSCLVGRERKSPQGGRVFCASPTPCLYLCHHLEKEYDLCIHKGLGLNSTLLFVDSETLEKPLMFAGIQLPHQWKKAHCFVRRKHDKCKNLVELIEHKRCSNDYLFS